MRSRPSRVAALAALLWLAGPVQAADTPSEEGLDLHQLTPDQRRHLAAGETIAYQVPESGDTELGAGVAMYLPVPIARVAEILTSSEIVLQDAGIVVSGPIAADATSSAAVGFRLSGSESGEAQEALDASPGSRFNLSTTEIEGFRATRATLRSSDRSAAVEAANGQWRALLFQRWQAFQARGLDGIAPYARSRGVSDPAALLRVAAGDARILATYAPRLADALLRYPVEQSSTARSQFYWVKRQVQGRPTAILIHHLVDVGPTLALYVERHVYVEHTYNASQILSAAVPYESGVLIFSSNRVSTDQVAGLGGDMKRMIGRRQLRGEIVKRFERIRAAVLRVTPPPVRVESP